MAVKPGYGSTAQQNNKVKRNEQASMYKMQLKQGVKKK